MTRTLLLAAVTLLASAMPSNAAGITGKYIEARTCDVWTGPCFANADMNLGGKHAVLGWSVDKGELNGVTLDGLGVVAVVAASDTLGLLQTGEAKAVLIVDSRANAAQRAALVKLAQQQGGDLVKNVVGIESARVTLDVCACTERGLRHAEGRPRGHRDALPGPQERQDLRQRVGLLPAAGQGRHRESCRRCRAQV